KFHGDAGGPSVNDPLIMLLYGFTSGLKRKLRSEHHQQSIRGQERSNPSRVFLAQQLVFPHTKRVSRVHDVLQILLLRENGKTEAADRQQNASKYCALHGKPSTEKKPALSVVLVPQAHSLHQIFRVW